MNKTNYVEEFIAQEDEGKLLEQFYVSLETSLFQIKNNQQVIDKEVHEFVLKMLETEKSWANAYKVEQMIIELYDENTLTYVLKRRLIELGTVLSPNQIAFYKDECSKVLTFEQKRALLEQLVDDLQWRYAIREQKMKYARYARRRSNYSLGVSILLFLGSIIFYYLSDKQFEFFNIIIMFSAGSLGASFSMLTGLRDIEEFPFNSLKIIHQYGYIVSRNCIGAVAALVVYYFIQSNLIGGELFQTENEIYKLVVWSFIAGFSEKLIPQLMVQSENKLITSNVTLHSETKDNQKTTTEKIVEKPKTEEKKSTVAEPIIENNSKVEENKK